MIKVVVCEGEGSSYAQDIIFALYSYAQEKRVVPYDMDIKMTYSAKGEKVLKVKTNIPYNDVFAVVNKVSEGPFDELRTFTRCLF